MSDSDRISDEKVKTTSREEVAGAPGVIAVPEDPEAPSKVVSSARQRMSDMFTIVRCRSSTGHLVGGMLIGSVLRRLCLDQ